MNSKMWLLVRSNPDKKDSIHYSFAEAQALQNHLARSFPQVGGKVRLPEKTEIHEITVDRELCSVAFIQTSFATSLEPNDG